MDDDDLEDLLDEMKDVDWESFEDFEEALQEIQNVICMDSDKFALDVLQTAFIEHIFENMDKDEGIAELNKRIESMTRVFSIWHNVDGGNDESERRQKIRLVVSNDKDN
jgi:hypothetical protein